MRRSWYLVLRTLCLLALVGSVVGLLYSAAREGWFLAHAGRAQGKVVSVQSIYHAGSGRNGNSYTDYLPTLSFQDAAGKAWTFTAAYSGFEGRRVGVVLPVLYNPANPADAQIASWHGEWSDTLGFVYVGGFALVGFITLRSLATRAKPTPPRDSATPASP